MTVAGKIKIASYDYSLPDVRIAKYPLKDRDLSKVLIYKKGRITEAVFNSLADILPPRSKLIFNDTKVIYARLQFQKVTGARIEIFCLEPVHPVDYEQSFQSGPGVRWKCMIGNQKKWKTGILQQKFNYKDKLLTLYAEQLESEIIKFSWDPPELSFSEILETAGTIPIPPYLNRKAETTDKNRYQTVYAHKKGSVAAPTAGLHFTPGLLRELRSKGFNQDKVTLHVGAGTFKPVSSETLEEHTMHTEHFSIRREFLAGLIKSKDPVIAVGTTSVRTLESLYWLGVKTNQNDFRPVIDQWEPYSKIPEQSSTESLQSLLNYMIDKNLDHLEASTRIIIVPGYRFRLINGLITNFHQPKSTLLLLIAAFIGNNWKKVYDYALNHDFRFLSYGDSSLLLP
jgi:S-adenosylmethionine:tRNA ribosyltransferase-isomerase